jgi:hypothetical protein
MCIIANIMVLTKFLWCHLTSQIKSSSASVMYHGSCCDQAFASWGVSIGLGIWQQPTRMSWGEEEEFHRAPTKALFGCQNLVPCRELITTGSEWNSRVTQIPDRFKPLCTGSPPQVLPFISALQGIGHPTVALWFGNCSTTIRPEHNIWQKNIKKYGW